MYPIMQKYGVSSPYGSRPDLIYGFHYGVDFPTPVGVSVPLVASGGVVYFEGWISFTIGGKQYNEIICVVNRDDGFADVYDHLSATFVNKGQRVKQGDIIGLTGRTGYVTGPHLHYGKLKKHYAGGILNNYGWVDPTHDLQNWGDEDVTTREFCKTFLDLIEDKPNYENEQGAALNNHIAWIEAEWAKGNPSAHRHWARGIMNNNKVLGRNAMAEHLVSDARLLAEAQGKEIIKEVPVEVIKEVPAQVDPIIIENANKWGKLLELFPMLGGGK